MAKDRSDIVIEATYARTLLTRMKYVEKPSKAVSQAERELLAACEAVKGKREALEAALKAK